MARLFEVIRFPRGTDEKEFDVRIGIRIKVGEEEGVFPVTRACQGIHELEKQTEALERDLRDSLDEARKMLDQALGKGLPEIDPDMAPEEIWGQMAQIKDEELFVRTFNGLGEETRRAVAEHVLTRCNIFSGKAAVFSSRYDSETALMD